MDALGLVLKIVSKAEARAGLSLFAAWLNGECLFVAVSLYSDVDTAVTMLT